MTDTDTDTTVDITLANTPDSVPDGSAVSPVVNSSAPAAEHETMGADQAPNPNHRGRRTPRRQGQGGTHDAGGPQKAPQRSREIHPALQKLFELYPKMFGLRFLPLKLGVFQELLALHPDEFKKDELKIALGLHARSTRYLESVASGLPRHDLNGEPVEPVAPEHVHHAILEIFRRRQARSNQDLRPYVFDQIMAAVEHSGLPLEDYATLVRTQDEATNALLDDVISALKIQAAKREALVRMLDASGKTPAEFSDMYGMNPDDVAYALHRVRPQQPAQAA